MSKLSDQEQLHLVRSWLKKARRLDQHIFLEEETQRFLNTDDSRFVLYSADTDIVMCYTSPWMLSSGSKGKAASAGQSTKAYGELFPPDENDPKAASSLTFALAQYLFFEHNNHWPVFQLPSHSSETDRVFSVAASRARLDNMRAKENLSLLQTWAEATEEQISRFVDKNAVDAQFMEELGKANKASTLQHEDLAQILTQVEQFVVNRDKSPTAEIDRYLSLLLKGALVSTHEATGIADDEPDGVAEILKQLSREGTISEWIAEISSRDEWVNRLNKAHGANDSKNKSDNRLSNKILTDANALARLEILNKRLEKLNGRLIFITGADTILNTAEKYDPKFRNKYIRHFHSFVPHLLAKAKNTLPEVKNVAGISDFLGFRALAYPREFSPKKVTGSISQLLETNPDPFSDIQEEWIGVRDKMILSSMTNSKASGNELENILLNQISKLKKNISDHDIGSQFKESLKKFVRKLRKSLMEEKLSLAAEFATTGTEFLLAQGVSKERNPPDVCFDSYKNAHELFAVLKENDYLKDLQPNLRERLKSLKEDTKAQEPGINDLGYLEFLVFSGVFATAGRWNIATELAGYAVDIAETNPETKSGSHISGREAYYIQASAVRLSARYLEDYSVARELLKKAKRALAEDKAGRPELVMDSLRFDAEEIAVLVSELHHSSMKHNIHPIKEDAENGLVTAFKLWGKPKASPNNSVVELQLRVNILQLISLILQNQPTTEREGFIQAVQDCFNEINVFFEDELNSLVRKTNLIKAYMYFAGCFLRAVGKLPTSSKIENLDNFRSIKGATVYDEDRYRKLHEQCRTLLESSSLV